VNPLPPLIEVEHLGLSYPTADGQITALEDLSFAIPAGQFVAIVGPSGSGKSSLLKLLGDLLKPTNGRVLVDGKESSYARNEDCFSYCFQNPLLLNWRTCHQNINLPLEIMHRQGKQDPAKILSLVGLDGWENRYPYELSGGMKHRVALARALVYQARVLVLDEPFSSVDEITRSNLNRQLIQLWETFGFTCLLSTHSISEAVGLADRVILLSRRPGRIKCDMTIPFSRPRTEELFESSDFHRIVRCLRNQLED
jgi:NitT/TauT family transport system ATP-binding protein